MITWYRIKSNLLSFLSDIRVYPGGVIFAGESSYQIKGKETREITDIIEPGDILLRRYSHYLGSILIKGYFSHAAIYIGDNSIIHMLGSGITLEDILTFLRCDDICVLRYKNKELINLAIEKAKKDLSNNIQYDYNFDGEDMTKFYCTEFVDNLFECPIKNKIGNNKVVLPDHFLNSDKFTKIWGR